MDNFITTHEATIRLGIFFGVFALMAIWELLAPRRVLTQPKSARWMNNIALVVVNTVVVRIIFPTAAVGVAAYAAEQQWGLFNQTDSPAWLAILASVILLDGLIYLQHVMFHAIPAFWRAVIIFEVVLNATSMFNHSNIRLPLGFDRLLRLFIVTPDMHRVHHSHYPHETNSNFGFSLSLWDRLFGTYRAQPDDGHENMVIGIDTFRDSAQCSRLHRLLLMPFQGKITEYAINSRQWDDNES